MITLSRTIERDGKTYRVYPFFITFNGIKINEIIIDPYNDKRPEIIDDDIHNLALQLDGKNRKPQPPKSGLKPKKGLHYFAEEPFYKGDKAYRLVWWLEDDCNYIGIRICFRNRKHDVRQKIWII